MCMDDGRVKRFQTLIIFMGTIYNLMSLLGVMGKNIEPLKKKSLKFIRGIMTDKFLILLISLVFLFGLYSVTYWRENYKFCSADVDSATELNVLYNSITGDIKRFYFSSIQQTYFIFDHINLTFIFYIIFFWLHPTRAMYYFMHGITLAIGAIPIYKISETRLKSKHLALMVSVLYLCNPILISFLKGCVISIRTYSTIPFLLFTWYFYEKKKYRMFVLFLVLSLLTKENVAPIAIMMGLYFLYKEKDKKWAVTPILGGIVILTLYLTNLFGYFEVIYPKVFEVHFGNKLNLLSLMTLIPKRFNYVIDIFSLFLFIPVLGIDTLMIVLPKLVENLLYSYVGSTIGMDIYIKNNAILIPFLFISIAYGLARIKKQLELRISLKVSKSVVMVILILLLLNFSMFFIKGTDRVNEFYRRRGIDWGCETDPQNYNKRWESLMAIKNKIPQSDGLLVDISLSLPFVDRKDFYLFRGENLTKYLSDENINYILFNQDLIDCLKETGDYNWMIDTTHVTITPNWEKIEEKDGFVLFKRV